MTTFNGWLLSKIVGYLTKSEGYTSGNAHYTSDGIRTTVMDSFGYTHEITIKTVSRIHDRMDGLDALNFKLNRVDLNQMEIFD